ncbi:MAG: alpha/beta hydrolase [Leucobacter sp.]
MTIQVPQDGATLLEGTPVFGAVDEIMAIGLFLRDVSEDAVRYVLRVQSAGSSLGEMTGQSTERIGAKLADRLLPGASAVRNTAYRSKTAFESYAVEVHRIHQEAARVQLETDNALGVIRTRAATIENIAAAIRVPASYSWHGGAPTTMPEPRLEAQEPDLDAGRADATRHQLRASYESEWSLASSFWHQAVEDVDAAKREWENLIEDRRNAERRLTGALSDTAIGQLLSVSGSGIASRRFTISAGIAGELWGESTDAPGIESLTRMLSGELPPDAVAASWARLEEEGVDTDALLRDYCFELAALDGLPFSAMDRAGRAALEHALDVEHPEQLEEAFRRMGFTPAEMSVEDFRTDLEAVRDAMRKADSLAAGDTIQLVALGRHDGAATAGISIGDLDAAETVGVFVSGMKSNVRGLSDAFGAFRSMREDDADMAMVTWVGYRAPGLPGETLQSRADAGGLRLASFLDGIAVRRRDDPIHRFVLLGHSYGTNVGAEALKSTQARVNAFVTIGSAGLKYGTTAEQLGVDEIHATHAAGDGIAQTIGQHVHFRTRRDGGGFYEARVDPRDLEGAREFSSEKTADGEAVTMHNLVRPIEWGPEGSALQRLADDLDGTAAADEIGYLDPKSSTVSELGKIMRDEWR